MTINIKTLFLVQVVLLIISGCAGSVGSSRNVSVQSQDEAGNPIEPSLSTESFADIPIVVGDVINMSSSLVVNPGERWIGRLVLNSRLQIQDVFEYYFSEMEEFGWRTLTSVQSESSVLMYEKEDRLATIIINTAGRKGSYVTVTVSLKQNQ